MGPLRVEAVPLFHVGPDDVEGDALPLGTELLVATAGPLLDGGLQEDLALRMGQHDGADVPPHDDTLATRQDLLLAHQGLPDSLHLGHDGNPMLHLGVPQASRDVRPIDQDPLSCVRLGPKGLIVPRLLPGLNVDLPGQTGQGRVVFQGHTAISGGPGDGPVHCAGVQEVEQQVLCQAPTDHGLADGRRTVYRDVQQPLHSGAVWHASAPVRSEWARIVAAPSAGGQARACGECSPRPFVDAGWGASYDGLTVNGFAGLLSSLLAATRPGSGPRTASSTSP